MARGGQVVSPHFDSGREAAGWRVEHPGIVGHCPLTLVCVLDGRVTGEPPISDTAAAIFGFLRGTKSCDCPYCERVREPI